MTLFTCAIHNVAFEDDATYEKKPPPARCPMCAWDEREGQRTDGDDKEAKR